jgi:hypothetical protein
MSEDYSDPLRSQFFSDEPDDDKEAGESTPFLFSEEEQIDEALQGFQEVETFDTYGIYDESNGAATADDETQQRLFLGMNALQRFILSVMIFVMVVILGAFCLILTGKVVLPFF